ncbi:MAG: Ig-like domain repeat protein [Nocardioides sp.]|uniref:Ig-like domain repeat protein n=1 Tax=Nocardioides sp. TaxID=35761 RepID=UPI003F0C188C
MRPFVMPFTPARTLRAGVTLLAAAAVSLAGLAPVQAAEEASAQLSFTCATGKGTKTFAATFDTDAPTEMYVGDAAVPVNLSANVTLPNGGYVYSYWWDGRRRVKGPVDFKVLMGDATRTATLNLDHPDPDDMFGMNSSWSLVGSGSAGTFTPSTPGEIAVSAGAFGGTLTWTNQYGLVSSKDTISCAPVNGQNNTIDTVRVISRSQVEIETPIADTEQGSGARVTAKVTVDGGAVAGTVRFTSGSQSVDVPVDSTGVVTATLPVLAPGAHQVTATFVPSDTVHYRGSTSLAQEFTVRAAQATSVSLTAPTSALTTETVQLRAVVSASGSSDVPVGRVDFLLDNQVVSTASISGAGVATAILSDLAVGSRVVKARFVPTNTNQFLASESGERTIEVTAPATETQTVLQVQPDTVKPTERATLSAQVFAGGASAGGEVEFTVENDEGWFESYPVPVAAGAASVQLPVMPIGEYRVTATFHPTDPTRYASSTSSTKSLSVKVTPAVATTTSVQLSPSTAFPGDTVQATVDVAAVSGSAVPSGEVSLTVGGRTESGPLVNGRVVLSFPAPSTVQQYPVVASFTSSDATAFLNSQSSARTLTVQARPAVATQTALSLSRSTVTEGASVTATATVTPAGAAGRVEFTVDGSVLQGAVVDGEASVNLPELGVGTYDVRARFVPADATLFTVSSSETRQLTVERRPAAATSTALGLSRTTATTSQPVVATAEVSSDYGRPTGTVTFSVGSDSVSAPVIGGVAEAPLPALVAGSHTVRASYTSDDPLRFSSSIATPVSLTVTQAPAEATVTTLVLLRNPVAAGQRAEARVEVAAASGEANGTATVTVNGSSETVAITSGVGVVSLPAVNALGSHPVLATFVPAAGSNLRSSTDTRTLQVVAGPVAVASTTVVTLSRNAAEQGQPVQATASVAVPGLAAAGQVVFRAESGSESTSLTATISGGEATVTLPSLAVGTWSVTGAFQPSGSGVAASTSAPVQLVVSPAVAQLTRTEVSLSSADVLRGEAVTASATVSATAGQPAGQVTFTVDGQQVSGTLVQGRASAVLPTLGAGEHQVVAHFVPADASRFTGSSSGAVPLSVSDATAVVLSLSAATTASDRPVDATATVTSTGSTPTGTVTFVVGGRAVTSTVVNGAATATLPALAVGDYQVVARFVPVSSSVRGSSASQPLVVTAPVEPPVSEPVDTTLNLSTDLTSSPYGKRVQAVAQVPAAAQGIVTFAVGSTALEVTVVNGRAAATLPVLAVGAHQVVATYLPRDPQSRKPATARTTLTVVKDSVRISFGKRWSKANRLLTHKTRVRPANGALASGTVKVVLEKKVGKKFRKVATHTGSLNGNGFVQFDDKLAKPVTGSYRVRITYGGSASHVAAQFTKSFRIG